MVSGIVPNGIVKHNTGYCPPPPPDDTGFSSKPDWVDHPSWITGMQALERFHHWVSAAVLPIAFQWIHENYDEVYEGIPDHLRDDVGVVIAAAFELVRKREAHSEAYKKGQKSAEDLKLQMETKKDKFDPSHLNPVWAKITREVRHATKSSFEAEKTYLDDTI